MSKRTFGAEADGGKALWIDLLHPTDEDRSEVERAVKRAIPSQASIEEIESSSRAYAEDGALYLSSPVLQSSDCVNTVVTSLGFVLSPERLVTVRFGQVNAFDEVAAIYGKSPPTAVNDIFLKLLETIIDHAADSLEHASAELEKISHASFRAEAPRYKNEAGANERLRAGLRRLGRIADAISHIRDTLLGFGRIAAFVRENQVAHLSPSDTWRIEAIRADINSLNDYHAQLSGKVQFLLDATLGFISIEQNDVVKTLTVVSIVGVPPVLIAGIYGMNFKNIPEYDWAYGYPYALALIVVSALVPLYWFKRRRWV